MRCRLPVCCAADRLGYQLPVRRRRSLTRVPFRDTSARCGVVLRASLLWRVGRACQGESVALCAFCDKRWRRRRILRSPTTRGMEIRPWSGRTLPVRVGKVEGGTAAPTPQGRLCPPAGGPTKEARRGDRGGLAPRVVRRAALACRGVARRRPECLWRVRVLADPSPARCMDAAGGWTKGLSPREPW